MKLRRNDMPMNNGTLKALKGSIKKWEMIVAGTGVDLGMHNCPLCARFLRRKSKYFNNCSGCPVAEHTGEILCSGTPCTEQITKTKNELYHARRELRFLKSLLP